MSVKDDYPAITILADACADKADDGVPEAVRAWREVARLRQWKAEADEVLAAWEGVWMIAGQPWPDETEALDRARAALLMPSNLDGPAWMELLAAATDALRHGEHDGPCWPRHWDDEACELHVSTSRDRYVRLAAAVDALKVP